VCRVAAKRVALGIDQGSSGARAVVMTSGGEVLGSGRAPCRDLRRTSSGTSHEAVAWLEESLSAARSALRAAGCDEVDAIGVGALGPSPVVIDAELRPLAASPLFPIEPVPEWVETLPADLASRAAYVVDVAGFLVGTFVGHPVMDRITAADHVVEGQPAGITVPDAREPFEVAGELTPMLAERLGVAPGAPVAVGTYDTFVDLAGIGITEPGSAAILLGSTVIVGVVREEADAPDGLRSSPHVGPGWFVGGWTSTAGRALGWAASLAADADRERIVAEVGTMQPGGGGVLALPYLDGERAPVWDPAARGAMIGLTTSTTLAQIYRGVLDGVVLSTLDLADRLESVRGAVPWTVAGGGVRDTAWLQATADALGEPVSVVDLPDAGAAARAGFAAIGEPLTPPAGRTVEPDGSARGRWQELAGVYRGMYEALADRMHLLGSLADEGVTV
jgi:xylulokinase